MYKYYEGLITNKIKHQLDQISTKEVCPKTGFQFSCVNTYKEIDLEVWNNLTQNAGIYFTINYLKAVEEGMRPQFSFRYVIFFVNDLPIGVSLYQILVSRSELLSRFNNKNFRFFDRINLQYLINGSVFHSGNKGFHFMDPNIDRLKAMKAVSDVSKSILKKEKRRRSVNVIVVKEFYQDSGFNGSEVEDFKYAKFHLEPNMILHFKEEWNNYDDYLAAMSKKFRSKSRSTYNKTQDITSKSLNWEEIASQGDRIQSLYESVYNKASFKLGMMSLDTFINLKKELEENYVFKAYYLNDKMLAFSTAFVCHSGLDANYIGIDYDYNNEYPIYHRILYDLVQEGFNQKIKNVNFGRTAGEIKSRLGAVPYDSLSYVHLRNKLVHAVLGPLVTKIKPKPFPVRNPFKEVNA